MAGGVSVAVSVGVFVGAACFGVGVFIVIARFRVFMLKAVFKVQSLYAEDFA